MLGEKDGVTDGTLLAEGCDEGSGDVVGAGLIVGATDSHASPSKNHSKSTWTEKDENAAACIT